MRRIAVLAVLLGASVVLNVVCLVRLSRPTERTVAPRSPEARPPADRAEMERLERENAELRAAASPAPVAAEPDRPREPKTLDRLAQELDRLREEVGPADYPRKALERTADFLELGEPLRAPFLEAGAALARDLAVVDADYMAAARIAYHAAQKKWQNTVIPKDAEERRRRNKQDAQDRLQRWLEPHVAQPETLARLSRDLVWYRLSRSGFAWSELE